MKTQCTDSFLKRIWSKLSKNQKRLFLISMCSTMTPTIESMASDTQNHIGTSLTYSDNELDDNDDLCQLYYVTVSEGDTLGDIAVEYNTTVAKIVEMNNIQNPNLIQVGQVLKVYGYKAEKVYDVNNNSFANKINSQGDAKGIDVSAVGQSKMDFNADGIDDLFDKYA